MSPTILLDNGSPILAVGASGGPRIITATIQVVLNLIEHDSGLPSAISQPRLHHQWQPDVVYRGEYPENDPVTIGLKRRGHVISGESHGAVVQAILIDGDTFIGVSDPRKGGRPAGLHTLPGPSR